jgi:hypothetical protein
MQKQKENCKNYIFFLKIKGNDLENWTMNELKQVK